MQDKSKRKSLLLTSKLYLRNILGVQGITIYKTKQHFRQQLNSPRSKTLLSQLLLSKLVKSLSAKYTLKQISISKLPETISIRSFLPINQKKNPWVILKLDLLTLKNKLLIHPKRICFLLTLMSSKQWTMKSLHLLVKLRIIKLWEIQGKIKSLWLRKVLIQQ